MVTYRAVAKPDRHADRFMLAPRYVVEARRASALAEASAREAFADLLVENPPVGRDAQAWLERSDRFGLRILERRVNRGGVWAAP